MKFRSKVALFNTNLPAGAGRVLSTAARHGELQRDVIRERGSRGRLGLVAWRRCALVLKARLKLSFFSFAECAVYGFNYRSTALQTRIPVHAAASAQLEPVRSRAYEQFLAPAAGKFPDLRQRRSGARCWSSARCVARGSAVIRALGDNPRSHNRRVADGTIRKHLAKGLEYAGKQAAGFEDYPSLINQIRPHARRDRGSRLHCLLRGVALDAWPRSAPSFARQRRRLRNARTIAEETFRRHSIRERQSSNRPAAPRESVYSQAQAMIERRQCSARSPRSRAMACHNNWSPCDRT